MMYYPMFYDPTYGLVLIAAILTLIVQFYMQAIFNKYQKVGSSSGLSASSAAKMILQNAGIYDVSVGRTPGNLTDHYAPLKKELNLSDATYDSTSIASIGVAAHEAGHAIQDHNAMFLLRFQMSIVPVVNFASRLSMPLIIIGLLLSVSNLMELGIIMFSVTLIYQLITLPVEFNASHNAIRVLRTNGMMDETELEGVKKVLTAAALTYVAAAATSILQLLRFMILVNNRRGRR